MADIEALAVQLARENSRWGYDRIAGELGKLGITLDPTTVKNILDQHGIPPAPQRGRSTWRIFLNHYEQQMLAATFDGRSPRPAHGVHPVFYRAGDATGAFCGLYGSSRSGLGHPIGTAVDLETSGSAARR
jgi:hypothetical protein